jgi:hypothetical protein
VRGTPGRWRSAGWPHDSQSRGCACTVPAVLRARRTTTPTSRQRDTAMIVPQLKARVTLEDHLLGSRQASVQLVLYGDYDVPGYAPVAGEASVRCSMNAAAT